MDFISLCWGGIIYTKMKLHTKSDGAHAHFTTYCLCLMILLRHQPPE